jgi:hypothetical protein
MQLNKQSSANSRQSKHRRDSNKWDSNLARARQLAVRLARGG